MLAYLILLIVPVTYACFDNTPFSQQAVPSPMTAGARSFSRRTINSTSPYIWLSSVTLPLQATSSVCSTYQLKVAVRGTRDFSSEPITTSVVDTTLCSSGNPTLVTFTLAKPFVLLGAQLYYLELNASNSVMWLRDNSALSSSDESLSLDSSPPTVLPTNLLVRFGGECANNDKCYDGDKVLPAGHVCAPSTSACQLSSVCTGSSVACPDPTLLPDTTPCTGGLCSGGICTSNTSCIYNGYKFSHGARWRDPCNNCSCYLGKANCIPLPCSYSVNNVPLIIAIIVIAILVIVFFFIGLVAGQLCRPKPDPRQRRRKPQDQPQPQQPKNTTTTTAVPKGVAETPRSDKTTTGNKTVGSVSAADTRIPMTDLSKKPKSSETTKIPAKAKESEASENSQQSSRNDDKDESDHTNNTDDTDDSKVKKSNHSHSSSNSETESSATQSELSREAKKQQKRPKTEKKLD